MSEKCKQKYDSIIKCVYREAAIFEWFEVYLHLKRCKSCKNLYIEHKIVATALRDLPEMECPESIIKKVEQTIGEKQFIKQSFAADFYSIFTRISFRTMVIGLVVVVVVIVFAMFYRNNFQSSQTIKYSTAEVEKANSQAQHALVLISKVLNSTQTRLENEILPKKVAKPLNKSFNVINDLFKSGDKNEKN
jgi:predicted anti-sigma-YlaC factor YlaD